MSEAGPSKGQAAVDVRQQLDQVCQTLERARSVPLSASCIVNRKELLARLAEVRRMLPAELAEARSVLEQRHAAIQEGRAAAARLIEEARRERDAIIHGTDIHQDARRAAERLLAEAREEAEGLRREVDDYVDQKLAGFEIALHKILAQVARGRELVQAGGASPEGRVPPPTPQEVDQFVEDKLGRFEHSLRKTLDAVVRGRERLRDRSGLDTFADDRDAPPLPT